MVSSQDTNGSTCQMYQFTPTNAEFRKNDNLLTLRQGKAT